MYMSHKYGLRLLKLLDCLLIGNKSAWFKSTGSLHENTPLLGTGRWTMTASQPIRINLCQSHLPTFFFFSRKCCFFQVHAVGAHNWLQLAMMDMFLFTLQGGIVSSSYFSHVLLKASVSSKQGLRPARNCCKRHLSLDHNGPPITMDHHGSPCFPQCKVTATESHRVTLTSTRLVRFSRARLQFVRLWKCHNSWEIRIHLIQNQRCAPELAKNRASAK